MAVRLKGRFGACRHRLTVKGLNLERFLNAVSREGIPLCRAERRDARTLVCECFSADLTALQALIANKGWRMEAVRPLGLSAFWAWMKRRPGVPAGAVLGMALAIVLSQFIWQVDVHNAGPYQAEVEAYLMQNGYQPGRLRSAVDAKALEQALTRRYPDIAWFHVYASGVRLVVEVTQGVPAPQLPSVRAADVVARHGGVVESIRVYAGTAAVRAGDAVSAGDVLIRGEERAADGQLVPVAARGAVIARCWESAAVRLPMQEIHSVETGRSTDFYHFRTPLFTWPSRQKSPGYLAWNTYVESLPLGGVFFPISRERVIQREVAMEYVLRPEADVRAEAEEAAFQQLKNRLFGYEIIDKWVDYCMIEDESLALSATAEWLMDISGSKLP